MPVRLVQEPTADLERDGKRLSQPRLGLFDAAVVLVEDREAARDVLHLEVGVAGALEPGARLEAKLLGLGRPPSVVVDDAEPRRRLRVDPLAAKLLRDVHTATKLRLGVREIVAHQERGDPEVTLGDEPAVVGFLREGDCCAEALDHPIELPQVVADVRIQQKGHSCL